MNRRRDRASCAGLLPLMEARPWRDGKTVTYRLHPLGGKPINLGTDRLAAIQRVLQLTRRSTDRTGALPDLHRDPGTTARIYDRGREAKRRSL